MDHGVPAYDLTDAELERQGVHAHATRHWVFLNGTAEQFRTHTQRMLELEGEYLRRHPKRTWQGAGGTAPAPVVGDVAALSRVRDLVGTFAREIEYLLGDTGDAPVEVGASEVALLGRVAAAPTGRLHKLEVHQAARELGSSPRAVAGLYKCDPPLLRAEGDDRVLTAAGRARVSAAGAGR